MLDSHHTLRRKTFYLALTNMIMGTTFALTLWAHAILPFALYQVGWQAPHSFLYESLRGYPLLTAIIWGIVAGGLSGMVTGIVTYRFCYMSGVEFEFEIMGNLSGGFLAGFGSLILILIFGQSLENLSHFDLIFVISITVGGVAVGVISALLEFLIEKFEILAGDAPEHFFLTVSVSTAITAVGAFYWLPKLLVRMNLVKLL